MAICCFAWASCASTGDGAPSRLLRGAGEFHHPITTGSAAAQEAFDQGLLLVYGFDHEQAIRWFERAAELDPTAAMPHWGMALAAGPNINNPGMDEEATRNAVQAVQRAQERLAGAGAVERDLVGALAVRYAWPAPADRKQLDVAYADAMREVWRRHPADADVGALCAEAIMDLRPWDLWSAQGEARPETGEVIAALNAVIALDATHPGANHYLIHTWEASPTPERGLPAADRLRNRVPGASHLVHMPGHIYIRLGRYADAIAANQRAIAVDAERVRQVGAGGFYALYRAHNYHFLMWAAMFDGQRAVALKAARDMVAAIPAATVAQFPEFVESFMTTPYEAMVRFGQWRELLAEPAPPTEWPSATAFWHYGRGVAFAATGHVGEAETELAAFDAAAAKVPASYTAGNNPTSAILAVARRMLTGEIAYRRGDDAQAFALLRQGVAADDALHYDEPWGWPQPVRHALGALLLERGRVDEAEVVYREDLARHPGNGWSLQGLAEALRRQNRTAEAAQAEREFQVAWVRSDIALRASCFCRTGAAGG